MFVILRVVFDTSTRLVYPFLPVLARAMGVDIATFSIALSARSATGFISPFMSTLVDYWGRKSGILIAIGLFVISNVLVVFFPVFTMFGISMVISSLGAFLLNSSLQAYLGDTMGYEKRGVAIGIIETGWATSFMLGMPVVGFLIARFSWLTPFQVLALLGAILFFVFTLLLPGNKGMKLSGNGSAFWQTLRYVYRSPLALTGLGMALCNGLSKESVNLVFGVWMEDTFGLTITALGFSASLIGVAEIIGDLSGGVLTWRLGKRGTVAIGYSVMIMAAIGLLLFGSTLPGALASLAVILLSYEMVVVGNITLMSQVLPEARATLIGTYIAFNSLGRTISALVTPRLYLLGFGYNLLMMIVFAFLALILLSRMRLPEQGS